MDRVIKDNSDVILCNFNFSLSNDVYYFGYNYIFVCFRWVVISSNHVLIMFFFFV